MSLRDELIRKGLVKPRDESVKLILARIRRDADKAIDQTFRYIARLDRKERFARGSYEPMRNPTSGAGVQGPARLMSAAGSDSRGKYRVSGMGTPVGMDWVKTRQEPKQRTPCRCDEHKKKGEPKRHVSDPAHA